MKIVLNTGSQHHLVKELANQKQDLIRRWCDAVLPTSYEIDRTISYEWDFYSTLCGVLLEVNPVEGARLFKRIKQVKGHPKYNYENTNIEILMYDLFRAEECEATSDVWDEIVDKCYTDIALLEIAIVCQKVKNTKWFQRKIEQYLKSDLLFDKARGINMLGFLDIKDAYDKLSALMEEIPDCWLRPVIEIAMKRWNRNRWARTWFQRFLEYEDEIKAWAAFKLFLKCADRRFWIWRDDLLEEFEDTSFFEKRDIFFELNRESVKKSIEKNEEKLKKEFLGLEIENDIWPWM